VILNHASLTMMSKCHLLDTKCYSVLCEHSEAYLYLAVNVFSKINFIKSVKIGLCEMRIL